MLFISSVFSWPLLLSTIECFILYLTQGVLSVSCSQLYGVFPPYHTPVMYLTPLPSLLSFSTLPLPQLPLTALVIHKLRS